MSETQIETDVVYEHSKLGEVLVTGIAKMYDKWDTTGPRDDLESGEVLVFYYDSWDGYGGMSPMPHSEQVDEFSKMVQRKRTFEYDVVSEFQEDAAIDSINEQMEERDYDSLDPDEYTK